MSILFIIAAAVMLLGPLIAIHEFGHFWVARRLGVKVMVFSIGFGPVIYKHISKKSGVQFQLAAVPLGGYVKMADEREGEVAEADLPFAFNRQSPWKRLAIVAAGPLINLLFAVFLFWMLFLPAHESLNTRVGSVLPQSAAQVAGLQVGDLIVAVDGVAVADLEKLNYALINRLGESGNVQLRVDRQGKPVLLSVPIQHFLNNQGNDPFTALGFTPFEPVIPPVIDTVTAGGPADLQGLKAHDRFVSINGNPIVVWQDATKYIKQNPEKNINLVIERTVNGVATQLPLTLMPGHVKDASGNMVGQLGVAAEVKHIVVPAAYKQTIQLNPWQALEKACVKTWDMSLMTVKAIGKMIRGMIGLENISGPITIAKVAGQTASIGVAAFFSFMALMSVSLGVMNLLPIPVLDGGHIIYYLIEGIMGKPVPESVQAWGMKIGVAMLGSLMVLALFNDVTHLF